MDGPKNDDSDGKSAFNSTTPNSNGRGFKSESSHSNETRRAKMKLPIEQAQVHMNDIIKENENETRNPLAFRFRKIENLRVSSTIIISHLHILVDYER